MNAAGRAADASPGVPSIAAGRLGSLREPAVRDLAWLLFSPDLPDAREPSWPLAKPLDTDAAVVAATDWLIDLDRDAGALREALALAHQTRLGRYAECLLGWFLRHGPGARLVAANVALRRAGRTLGECDFLVTTPEGRRLHWELAVKCYLHAAPGEAESGTLSDFVGPNLQDRFDLKLAHLLDHQLPLSAREAFATLGYDGPWEAQMIVKGWLFYRAGANGAVAGEAGKVGETEPSTPVPGLSPRHLRGWWVTHADWPRFASHRAEAWRVLPRLEWLAPRRMAGEGASMSDGAALFAGLAHPRSPVMVAGFVAQDGEWRECSRGFIVPDDWPARAQAFARH
ncbi:DUF1853 domain-containing protein [Burkholderia sp. WAC0059]|uniref:DUF1853 family protein n=1 Tax=Burkholderia sp. WAC0059 TaxID=2066022 RepID=UPI000C7F2B4F|nr:DUF1853 family protein [Burkholderia sp. WAC0059]PLZ02104.1 DUF1853 domain-containing protein [Burkholderia sp. WAC0059]